MIIFIIMLGYTRIVGILMAFTRIQRSSSLLPSLSISIAQRHSIQLLVEGSPVLCRELGILDTLLAPLLVCAADVVLRVLEVHNLIANALLYENSSSMLVDNRLLVL